MRNLWILRKKLLSEVMKKEENRRQGRRLSSQDKNLLQIDTSHGDQAIKLTSNPLQRRNVSRKRNPPQGGLPQSSRTNPPQSGLTQGSQNPPQGGLPLSSKKDSKLRKPP